MEEKNDVKKKSWFEKNAWFIALVIALWVIAMINSISKP